MLINRRTRTNCSNIQPIIRRTGNYFMFIVVFAVNYCNLRVLDCHTVLLKTLKGVTKNDWNYY